MITSCAGRTLALSLLLILSTSTTRAGILPAFRLHAMVWPATDIVVVTKGPVIDGEVTVVETWKGKLAPGDKLSVKELAEFASAESRLVDRGNIFGRNEANPVFVSGKKMVLFLKRAAITKEETSSSAIRWEPASIMDSMKVSIAWVEEEIVYVIDQPANPGPQVLSKSMMTARDLQSQTAEITYQQISLTQYAVIPDLTERAQKTISLIKSGDLFVRREAFSIIHSCKGAAVPFLRQKLSEIPADHASGEILDALAAAGGAELGPEFTRMFETEVKYWKTNAPFLPSGWWNDMNLSQEKLGALRNHSGNTQHILQALGKMGVKEARKPIKDFRDYLQALPQKDFEGMSQACDTVLKALEKP